MVFTDDDLKRLKDGDNEHPAIPGLRRGVHMDADLLQALLNRLEEAEAFIAASWLGKGAEMLDAIYTAWRKAAGK